MKLEILHHEPDQLSHAAPIVLVHGILHAAWCWEQFQPYFAQQGYRSYAISLRGHGSSEIDGPLRWARASDYVDDLVQALAEIAVDNNQVILVGHSMGGLVVQKYLERYPAAGAVLLASVPPHGIYQAALRALAHFPLKFLRVILTANVKLLVETIDDAYWFGFSRDLPLETVQKHHARMNQESYAIIYDMLLLALPRPAQIQTPMLVLGGEIDSQFSPAEVRSTARAYRAESEIFSGMGHDMMLDLGWQAVADRILAWLDARDL
jgi:pimeloyl-ACP methyl ester carboxylesterase